MLNITIIGGNFDEFYGSESSYITKFYQSFKEHFNNKMNKNQFNITLINGGNILHLLNTIDINQIDVLMWFPNISNLYERKILNEFKVKNNKLILIQSKLNNGRYSYLDLIARMLHSKANLLIEFNKDSNNIISSTILDALGNEYYQGNDINALTFHLINRLRFILSLTRISTKSISNENLIIPNNQEFFEVVENYGKVFHTLIHAVNQSRYLGNCSFRCEKGFSSFKEKDIVYMSKRNLDKRNISTDSFVPVILSSIDKDNSIKYYGEHKPSVDTPIQIRLYEIFKNINYMIHSHVYIEDAPFTSQKIPCGAIEEVDEILETLNKNGYNFYSRFYAINLIGHGSLIMADDVSKLKGLKYFARQTLEK